DGLRAAQRRVHGRRGRVRRLHGHGPGRVEDRQGRRPVPRRERPAGVLRRQDGLPRHQLHPHPGGHRHGGQGAGLYRGLPDQGLGQERARLRRRPGDHARVRERGPLLLRARSHRELRLLRRVRGFGYRRGDGRAFGRRDHRLHLRRHGGCGDEPGRHGVRRVPRAREHRRGRRPERGLRPRGRGRAEGAAQRGRAARRDPRARGRLDEGPQAREDRPRAHRGADQARGSDGRAGSGRRRGDRGPDRRGRGQRAGHRGGGRHRQEGCSQGRGAPPQGHGGGHRGRRGRRPARGDRRRGRHRARFRHRPV
ncbi:MAG: hypothetical protein AVDCRST_MAG22-3433, partial [uncultured Rubrobacteraceae bacterium]